MQILLPVLAGANSHGLFDLKGVHEEFYHNA